MPAICLGLPEFGSRKMGNSDNFGRLHEKPANKMRPLG